jgi:hypothetical protein
MKFAKMLAISTLTVLSLLGLTVSQSSAAVIIVDCNGPSDFNSIQEAIDNIVGYGTIEVRPGIYYENISFYGKEITVTSTNPDDVNIVGTTVIDGNGVGNVVTFNNGETDTSVLLGLTIQNGQEGIYCYKSDPLIRKCVAIANTDAGIYCDGAEPFIEEGTVRSNDYGINGSGSATPIILETIVEENVTGINNCDGEISDCKIIANSLYGLSGCDGEISSCEIIENSSQGIRVCQGQITNCTISGNGGPGVGGYYVSGGLFLPGYTVYSSGLIKNCTIRGNGGGGLVYSTKNLINCLITGNNGNGCNNNGGKLTNCTIIGNKGDGINCNGNTIVSNNIIAQNDGVGCSCSSGTLRYNNVWRNLAGDYSGVTPGAADISVNPFFAVPGYWNMSNNWVEGEYHLLSTAGRWDVNDWVNDTVGSPCIDAGDPCSPIGVEPNPNGGIVNQGVYGGTVEASKSPSGIIETVCTNYPAMDFNKDCKVNFEDFAVFTQEWLYCNFDPPDACWE